MDPWRDCRRLFEPHFFDRMYDRFLPVDQVESALIEGVKEADGAQKVDGSQDFKIQWRDWTLVATRVPCTIVLKTAFSWR